MTLNREVVTVKVVSYTSGIDEYGQTRQLGSSDRDVPMVLKQRNVVVENNPNFAEITVEGITPDMSITDADTVEFNGVSYGIKYVIPSKKYLQLMMYRR